MLDRPGTLRLSIGWQRLDLTEGHAHRAAPQSHLALNVSDLERLVSRMRFAGILVDAAAAANPFSQFRLSV